MPGKSSDETASVPPSLSDKAVQPDEAASRWGWRATLAMRCGQAVAWASRQSGRGSGGMIGGKIAAKLDPQLLRKLARGRKIALVTGTNGKTSTTRMMAEALESEGFEVASNRGGDNMTSGILTALMEKPQAAYAVIEVDEMHLQSVAEQLKPQVIVLLNLSRDQLDRVGEITAIERRIRQTVMAQPQAQVVVNVDDPLMTSAAWQAQRPIWVAAGKGWSGDSLASARSGGAIIYENPSDTTAADLAVGASGTDTDVWWKCVPVEALLGEESSQSDTSQFARPQPDWVWKATEYLPQSPMRALRIEDAEIVQDLVLRVNLPGRANRGNALQALVGALCLGASPQRAIAGIEKVKTVAGRYAQVEVAGKQLRMLLAKNPAGWMESLTMLNPRAQIIVGVNAQRGDGMDLSWLWDVNFESLRGKTVVATGERGTDLQVRLEYAGIDTIYAPSVLQALEQVPPGEVDMLLNYTCFRDTRVDFIQRGWMQ